MSIKNKVSIDGYLRDEDVQKLLDSQTLRIDIDKDLEKVIRYARNTIDDAAHRFLIAQTMPKTFVDTVVKVECIIEERYAEQYNKDYLRMACSHEILRALIADICEESEDISAFELLREEAGLILKTPEQIADIVEGAVSQMYHEGNLAENIPIGKAKDAARRAIAVEDTRELESLFELPDAFENLKDVILKCLNNDQERESFTRD